MFEYNLDLSDKSYMRDYSVDGSQNPFLPKMLECGYFEAGENYFTHRDNKNAALIIYTVSGSGSLETCGQRFSLIPGSVIVFKCVEEHFYKTENSPWCFNWIHCDIESLSGYGDILFGRLLDLKNEEEVKMRDVFYKLKEIHEKDDMFSLGYRSLFISEMLGVMLRTAENESGKNIAKSEEIEKALEFISNNLPKQITLDELSEVAHMSKYHFIRVCRRYTGFSPYRYLMIARINKAKVLLTTTRFAIGCYQINNS